MTSVPTYFICYARADTDVADRIEAKLASRRRRGQLNYWRDRRNLDVGDRLTQEIRAAIGAAAGAVVLVSDEFYESSYIQTFEWPAIEERLAGGGNFRVFPVAMSARATDDRLASEFVFVNDPARSPLRHTDPGERDRVLTELSELLVKHASTGPPRRAVPDDLPAGSPGPPIAGRLHEHEDELGLQPGLHSVPALPRKYAAPPETDELVESILSGTTTVVTGLQGEGGTGKTVLAAAAARELEPEFAGGVHWVTVGSEADSEAVRRLQQNLLGSLGFEADRQVRDLDDGRELLRQVLAERPALLVIDDVWHPWQARAFDAAEPGGRCRVLYTTRFPQTTPRGAASLKLGRLSKADSVAFVSSLTNQPPSLGDMNQVVRLTGGLRLALAVLAAAADSAAGWAPLIERFDGLETRFGDGDDASSAQKALHVASQSLSPSDVEHLWRLAAMPPDSRIPMSAVRQACGLSEPAATTFADRLVERRLVTELTDVGEVDEPAEREFEIHDHVLDFLILESPLATENTHLRLFEAGLQVARSGWSRLRSADTYLWEKLLWHGCRAGVNVETLASVVGDLDWLVARVGADGAAAAARDLQRVCESGALADEAPLEQMRRVLLHDALFDDLAPSDLRTSLECWVDSVGLAGPENSRPLQLRTGSLPVPSPSLLRTLRGQGGFVWAASFSSSGDRILTASTNGSARVWDPSTGQTLFETPAAQEGLWDARLDVGAERLVTGGHAGSITVWDLREHSETLTIRDEESPAWRVCFDASGLRLGVGRANGSVAVRESGTGQLVRRLEGHRAPVTAVRFHPNGRILATASLDGSVKLWDAAKGALLRTLDLDGAQVWGLSFDGSGDVLATASADGSVRIWDSRTTECHTTLAVRRLADTSRSSETVEPAALAEVEGASGQTITELTSNAEAIFDVALSTDGSSVAAVGFDGTTRVWDVRTEQLLAELDGHTATILSAAFDSEGRRLVTSGADGTARIWAMRAIGEGGLAHGPTMRTGAVAVDPSAQRVAVGSADAVPSIWNLSSGMKEHDLVGHHEQAWSVAFDSTGYRLATGRADGSARLWDVSTGDVIAEYRGHDAGVWGVAIDPTDSRIATASADRTARIWGLESQQLELVLSGHTGRLEGIAFDQTGDLLATAGFDRTARVWDATSGLPVAELRGHADAVYAVAFSPSGASVATSSYDGTACIWDVGSGRRLVQLTGHTNQVWGVTFTPDGERLVTASVDGSVRVWDATTGQAVRSLGLATSGSIALQEGVLAVSAGRHWAGFDVDWANI